MKKIIISFFIIIFLVVLFIVIYPVIKNDNYDKKLINNIYNNTEIEKVEYLNKDNNYYIVKDKEKIVVYNLNYEEVYSITLDKIKESKLDFVYRRNKLYYIDKKVKKEKVIYKFYDVISLEEVYKTTVGGH